MTTSEKNTISSKEFDMPSPSSSTSSVTLNMNSSNQKYSLLSGEDKEDAFPEHQMQVKHVGRDAWSTGRKALCLVLPILALAIAIATIVYKLPLQSQKEPWTHCGNSSSEAKALGCHFDIMMHSWVPHDCYYASLSEEYISANDFRFFSDSEATIEVPLEIVRLGDFEELYSGLDHHVLHCAYIWRLLVISTNENRRLDSLSSDVDHTGHCTMTMLQGLPWMEPSVGNESVISPDFLRCGYY